MAYQPKSYRKFLAGTVTAAVVASAVTPAAAADKTFPDVESLGSSYQETKEAIYALVDAKVITGYEDGTFKPFNDINRGQVAKMIVRYLDLELPEESAGVFADLSADSEFVLYAEALYNADIVSGVPQKDGTITFGAGDPLTREQMAKILVNALDLEGTDEEVDVKDLDEAAADQREYIQTLAQLGLTTLPGGEFNPKDTVKRSQLALFLYRASDIQVEEVSVSAVGAKKLEVKFDQAVDTSKAAITVKKGTSNIGIAKITFADNAKSAVVELNSKLTTGTYSVNVSGLTDEVLTDEVEVENEKVAGLELTSDKALITNSNEVQVGYKVVNQYGEDITSSTAMYSIVPNATNGYQVTSTTSGTVTLTKTGAKAGETFTLTLIDSNSAVATSEVVTVSDKAVTAAVEFAGIFNSDGLALNEDNKAEAFYLTINAKDQYGTVVTDPTKLEEDLIVTVSNPSVLDVKDLNTTATDVQEFTTYEDKDKNKFTAIALNPKAAGESIITVVSKANGVAVSYKVTVDAGLKLDTVSLGSPNGLVAGLDTVLVPLSVTDNKGNEVTDATKVDGKLVFSGSGYTGEKVVNKDGALYVQLVADATTTKTSLVLTVQSQTNKFDTEVITVNPTATAKAVIGLKSDVPTYIYAGETLPLASKNFVVQDQYGREMDTTSTSFTAIITATDNTSSSTVSVTDLNVIAGEAKGTETVTFALQGVENSATDVTFRVVDRSEFISYEVADISTLYANGTAASFTDAYAASLSVYGVTSDGTKVKLPYDEYTVYEASSYLDYSNGVLDAYGDTVTDKTYEATLNVVVTINATGDEFTKQVTVSEAAPAVEKVEYQVESKAVTSIKYDDADVAPGFTSADISAGIVVTDTYGVKNPELAVIDRLTFTNVKEKDGSDVKISANGTGTASLTNLAAGDTFDVTIVIDGKSLKLSVTVE